MHFETEHRFDGPHWAVADLLVDPGFYTELELPDLSRPEVVAQHQDDAGALLRLRYEFLGHLDPLARRLLGGRQLAWSQELQLEASRRSGTLRYEAEGGARLLHGRARFSLDDGGSGRVSTVRRLAGELTVALPGFGGMAERRIVPGVLGRLDLEAAALNRRVETAPPREPPEGERGE